ncbi:hypothetical protein NP233_g6712 [Leucocoprinus birnbaumii]|uniref:Uncharacterized protein n=1 Tax=Leucocoprinus birnbaumii TaxID=56174 RepID=A0AAD5VQI8_9AGAR|nr:hypothetical protein NP233_g6712 [Leucocoprinus birnbaumii]
MKLRRVSGTDIVSSNWNEQRRALGPGLKGVELFKAINTLEDLQKPCQEEEEVDEVEGDGVATSKSPAANVVPGWIADLLTTLRASSSESLLARLAQLNLTLQNGAGARLWIETIFFPGVGYAVGSWQEDEQTGSLTISGTVEYATLAIDPSKHPSFIRNSRFQYIKRQDCNGSFVTEAKQGPGVPLAQHVAQAIAETYASAKYLSKDILCGRV